MPAETLSVSKTLHQSTVYPPMFCSITGNTTRRSLSDLMRTSVQMRFCGTSPSATRDTKTTGDCDEEWIAIDCRVGRLNDSNGKGAPELGGCTRSGPPS